MCTLWTLIATSALQMGSECGQLLSSCLPYLFWLEKTTGHLVLEYLNVSFELNAMNLCKVFFPG